MNLKVGRAVLCAPTAATTLCRNAKDGAHPSSVALMPSADTSPSLLRRVDGVTHPTSANWFMAPMRVQFWRTKLSLFMNRKILILTLLGTATCAEATPPALLDERFELPSGFHIYRAAGPELTGGSYAMTFDGEGRLLVGDGNAVRRLIDRDNDGVFDSFEVIATGLGWRGPQGLLVYGDRLFAVGGDGIQLFEGYRSGGTLVHRGRIGNKLGTGGDHDAHTIFRGHDGYLYFMAGKRSI